MTTPPFLIIYTQDDNVKQRLTAYAGTMGRVRHVRDPLRLDPVYRQSKPAILMLDLLGENSIGILRYVRREAPDQVVIALGADQSDPAREAEMLGVYATTEREPERRPFQELLRHALEHLDLQQQLHALRQQSKPASTPPFIPSSGSMHTALPLEHFSRAFRHFENPQAFLDSIVEGIAGTAKVARVGLYTQENGAGPYALQAGLRCLEETSAMRYEAHDPLVRQLEIHAHLVARSHLELIQRAEDRQLLQQALDCMGAEIIIPLFTRGRLQGWMFLGHRNTGIPFETAELEQLMVIADHITTSMENVRLYEEVTLQKTLAETLFHSMPIGIAAVGADGYVRWYNHAAERILEKPRHAVINQPVAALGGRLADLLHRTYLEETIPEKLEWVEARSKRPISVQTRRLMAGHDTCMGAVALIEDRTSDLRLKEKQDQLERAAFWADLASSMSHEIRNPLVAIKTFAQLLPERYEDPEFRSEFSTMVNSEVDRLNGIIDQIHNYANPPALNFQPVYFPAILDGAIQDIKEQEEFQSTQIHTEIMPNLPPVAGDTATIQRSIEHLLQNAGEALAGRAKGQIDVKIVSWQTPQSRDDMRPGTCGVAVHITDNGPGIPDELQERLYSPFCTTKARGMGLGLAIAKRTVIDHGGHIHIDSDSNGSTVSLFFPATPDHPDPGGSTTHY